VKTHPAKFIALDRFAVGEADRFGGGDTPEHFEERPAS
jgi:hypothetical protein